MKNFSKKKYIYTAPINNPSYTNTKRLDSRSSCLFFTSPIPLSESITIAHLYNFLVQDSLWRYINKNTNNNRPYDKISSFNFSQIIYKAIGNQTFNTEKIYKQKKQNLNKITQIFSLPSDYTLLPIEEENLLNAQQLFTKLYKSGSVLLDENILDWDTSLKIEIPPEDRTDSKVSKKYYEIKFFVDGKGDSISTYSYDPYTLFSTVAIAVHPKDRRYKKHHERNVIIPIINKKIPIITDESINMIDGQGAIAINPAHEKESLSFALRHNLPVDQYCFSEGGLFTSLAGRFSGEKVETFKENISKFLQDIGNLNPIKEEDIVVRYNKYTNTPLESLKKKMCSLVTPETLSNEATEEDNHNITKSRPLFISSYAKAGSLIPIFFGKNDNYIFDQEQFIKDYPNEIFLLLIIHISLEGRLGNFFHAEKLTQLLLENSCVDGEKKYMTYLKKYVSFGISKNEIDKIINLFEDGISASEIKTILESSLYIEKKKDSSYHILRSKIFNINENVNLQQSLYFHKDFLSGVSYLPFLKSANDIFITVTSSEQTLIKVLKFLTGVYKINTSITFFPFPTLTNEKNEDYYFKNAKIVSSKFQSIQKKYGPDLIRLLLIKNQGTYNNIEIDIPYYSRLIQKVWNMCRLAFFHRSINLSTIHQTLKKDRQHLNEFDFWIINITNDFNKKIYEHYNTDIITKNIKNVELLEEYILSYFDHYLEIQKYNQSSHSAYVVAYCLLFLLKNLEIYLPLFCSEIDMILGYSQSPFIPFTIDLLEYKANLFNDIILKVQNIRLKYNYLKHNPIDVCVYAGPDIIQFIEKYTITLKNILNIKTLTIFEDKDKISDEYICSNIIDMVVGVKKLTVEKTKKNQHENLEKQIVLLEDELQRKKIILGRFINAGNEKKINEKKEEISLLKKNLEDIKQKIESIK